MTNFYQKIFDHKKSDIPSKIEKTFKFLFKNPVDVEWNLTGEFYEALFYENEQEKIARFDREGKLSEIRINHAPRDFTAFENTSIAELGTIMNYIEIRKEGEIHHELIIQKPDLSRMLLLLNLNLDIIRQESL